PLTAAVARDRFRHSQEVRRRDTTPLLNHLRGVAGEVPPQHVEDAARMLQRRVLLRLPWVECRTTRAELMSGALPFVPLLLLVLVPLVLAHADAVVLPGLGAVRAAVSVEAAEQPVEVLRVAKVLTHQE